jgi:adenine phosphoribosyltransferase
MKHEILKKSLLEAPIVKKGDYFYVIHPITDGVPDIKPELLNEVVDDLQIRIEKCGKIDKILTVEAMGIPLATALSSKMNIPFVIIRKRSYGLPGEYEIEQKTGYSKSNLFINGLKKGNKIVIVDDVLSTGGTLKAIIIALKKIGVIIKGIFIVINKGKVAKKFIDEFKINIETITDIEVIDGKVIIKKI